MHARQTGHILGPGHAVHDSELASVMTAVSQWERKVIGERTSAALQALKASGKRLGRPVALSESPRQRIATERRFGSTYKAIADRLNADDIATVNSGPWHAATVADVVKSVELDEQMTVFVDAEVQAVGVRTDETEPRTLPP